MNNDIVKLKTKYAKKFGNEYVNVDGKVYKTNAVPTGSLMLDYRLGIGGFPYGGAVEVLGSNKIGKSSALGYPVLGNVQKMGGKVGLIQVEPRFRNDGDFEWAKDIGGFDAHDSLLLEPDHADEAFDMLRALVFDNDVNFIMIDTLGALGTKTSAVKDGKVKAYGISGAVTSVMNDIMPRLHKNGIGLLVLNQVRQKSVPGTTMITYDSPGGEGLHHNMMIRIHLKPGGDKDNRVTATVDGEKIMIGRDVKAQIIKHNMYRGAEGRSATFKFFHVDTEEYGLGIDKANDVANAGILAGVFDKSGGWLEHETFPVLKSGEHKINGAAAAGQFLLENPDAYGQVRSEVMAVMTKERLVDEANRRLKKQIAAVTLGSEEDDNEVKYIDGKEFRETGFLQEANRLFFHPHGLALEITVVEDDGWIAPPQGRISKRVETVYDVLMKEFGEQYATNVCHDVAVKVMNALHPPGSEFISGVWDDRDDPEGVWFDFPSWPDGYSDGSPTPRVKYQQVLAERQRHTESRRRLFENAYSRPCSDIEPIISEERPPEIYSRISQGQ